MPLLEVSGLRVAFPSPTGPLVALEGLDLTVEAGETVALVGESGSGKSVASLAIMGLLPAGTMVTGRVRLKGADVLTLPARERRARRSGGIAMVFQEPMTSLNPVLPIGRQIIEALPDDERRSRTVASARAVDLLASVGLTAPERRLSEYPHQISGGMRQRVMIAIALASRPALIIADEPTTALDVTVQAQIVALLRQIQDESGTALLLVSHDLALVRQMARRVAVMYAGRIVEQASVEALFARPRHPYSAGLVGAIPRLGGGRAERLVEIPGLAPGLAERGPGCAFAPRCPQAAAICASPPPAHGIACHFAEAAR
ncbi:MULTISPECIES: ABC transporter ATP-binding protein [unclassified Novosphingobium]|uniref:ABC transporter ATP-binding protein n=1 Tax=unclassified Novosphingobium TaxID=2644732 RepID=UPI000F5D954C|nr:MULTISPECIES: ABC transporter ATP-binding protein [unclassified Novosphingobium]MBF5092842.1 ABC transporter ATP-binding protein [Novosphingobium sp. NBM11]RQW44737.1 ABC transporter ATP-binding protein [Novosphingobium sp. LASN5T]